MTEKININQIKLTIDDKDLFILQSIKNGWVNNEHLCQIINYSDTTISRRVDKLEELHLVQRIGGGRHTSYELTTIGHKITTDCLYQVNVAYITILSSKLLAC